MLTKILTWGSSALAWWRVALIGAAVLAASNGATALYAYNAGWRNAEHAAKAATLTAQEAHTAWLVKMAQTAGALSVDDTAAELTNEQIQGAIDDAILKGGLVVGECMSTEFLRELAKLR